MTKVNFLSVTTVDDLVNALQDKGTVFKNFRHSGSKFDKFRTLVRKIMGRINFVSDVVAQPAVNVSDRLVLLRDQEPLMVVLSNRFAHLVSQFS